MARIIGSRFSDDIYGTDSSDTIEGLEGHDRIWGRGGDDLLIGGSGDDELDGGSGADRMEGGTGDDIYVVDSTGDQVIELAGQGIDAVYTTLDTYRLGGHVEDLIALSERNFHGIGNGLDNYIFGYTGDDVLDGAGGNDVLFGDLGDDAYFVDDAGDEVVEYAGEGYDTIFTSLAALTLAAHVEELIFDGAGAFSGTGNAGHNYIEGGAGNDRLDGRAGDDILVGGAGADLMIGGLGNDTFFVDSAGDVIAEAAGEGHDNVAAAVNYGLTEGAAVEVLSTTNHGGTAPLTLVGNSFGQTIIGNAGNNYLDGGAGADNLQGLGGNDTYIVDRDDVVREAIGGGNDTVAARTSFVLNAGAEVEVLTTTQAGGTAAIDLTGNGFSQSLFGNAGANVLDGRGGYDLLQGFGGADTFAFTTTPGAGNVDTIADMISGVDRIALDNAVFAGLPEGVLVDAAFRIGSSAQDADDRIIYDPATGALYFDADGNGAAAAVQFASLPAGTPLASADFIVF